MGRGSGTVYLIAQPTVARNGSTPDLRPLAEHGEIRVLIAAGEYPTFHPERCRRLIEDRLKHFNPETDFLAWAGGDTLAAVMAGMVLADMADENDWPTFRWLRYERGKDAEGRRTEVGAHYAPIEVPTYNPADSDPDQGTLFHEGTAPDGTATD